VLDYREWPSSYIPIIPCIGEEITIYRQRYRKGIARDIKDAQRNYNYFAAVLTESVGLQPKTPFIMTENQAKGYEHIWSTANREAHNYLPYRHENGAPPPMRTPPPQTSSGAIDGMRMAIEDMKNVTGLHDASIGRMQQDRSGVAMLRAEEGGDVSSYVYIDNFARALVHTGYVVGDLIPHVYDTERELRILGENNDIETITVNERAQEGDGIVVYNDITSGVYDVISRAGASLGAQREQDRRTLLEIMRTVPQVMQQAPDILIKSLDVPDADKIAARLSSALPQEIKMRERLMDEGVPADQIDNMIARAQAQAQQAINPYEQAKMVEARSDAQKAALEVEEQRLQNIGKQFDLAEKGLNIKQLAAQMSAPTMFNNREAILAPNNTPQRAEIQR